MSLHTRFSPKPTGYFVWKMQSWELCGSPSVPLMVAVPDRRWVLTMTIPAICTSLSKH